MRIPGWMPAAAILAALCLSLSPPAFGQAQSPIELDLAPPDASDFPAISLFVTARAPAEADPLFLTPQDFVILEDQVERPLTSLDTVQTGLDLRLAINTTQGMHLRDASGQTRYDRVAQALVRWLSDPGASHFGRDLYSLITREGTLLEGVPAAAEVASTIDYLQPAMTAPDTALDLLMRGLELEGADTPPGTPHVLVFVTPFVNLADDPVLADVVAAAQQRSIAIFPVIVGPAALAEEPALGTWRTLAQETGGSLALFDPLSGFDPTMQGIDRLRDRYHLTYTSAASSQGEHTVQVRLVNEALDQSSPPQTFLADVLEPEVVFVSPPTTISIEPLQPGETQAGPAARNVTLPLLITFPDGHSRPIVETELLVDGILAASRVQAPFDVLSWSVDPNGQADEVTLQAGVTDSLGLRGVSEPITLHLEVTRPPSLLETRPWLIGVMAVLLTATAAAVGLIPRLAARRLSSAALGSPRPRLRRASLVPAEAHEAEASLQPIEGDVDRILLTGMDVTLGRDASLVTHVLFDPSVSAVHARLIRQVSGRYLLRDQDTIAGTWVNHEAVPQGGRALEHGDLVHFGRLGYRFLQSDEPEPRQILVTPQAGRGSSPARGTIGG